MDNKHWITPDQIKPENFPVELKRRDQWVAYKIEKRGAKLTKPPIDPKTGRLASPTNPDTWADFATARGVVSQYSGLGYVLTKEDDLVMIDLDHCIVNGEVEGWAQRIVQRLQ